MAGQRIIPNIWCHRVAEQAGAFYASALPGTTAEVTARYPDEGLREPQRGFAGLPVTVDVRIGEYRITLINAGDQFRPQPSISFLLAFDPRDDDGDASATRRRVTAVWDALSEGGTELIALGAHPFSPWYGWIEDRYGVSWQPMIVPPEGERRPFVTPQLTFGGAVQNRAREAMDFYTGLLPDSGILSVLPHTEPRGPARPGDVLFARFRLAGQEFAAMDSGTSRTVPFDGGVSLEVRCDGQAEIDRMWRALSAVPEAEACGWCADRFGVSWQVVPSDIGELLQRPDAFAHLMSMKRIVIDEL